jgi:hypothetical protein
MIKKWDKIGETTYAFVVDNKEIGTLDIEQNSIYGKAIAKIGSDQFVINRNGFWKSSYKVTDNQNIVIVEAAFEKWYASSLDMEYKGKKYKLVIRNNPLAEWVIVDGEKDVLAYGLNPKNDNGASNIKITGSANSEDYILHFLMWYLFVPFASENTVDMNTIMMLFMASS